MNLIQYLSPYFRLFLHMLLLSSPCDPHFWPPTPGTSMEETTASTRPGPVLRLTGRRRWSNTSRRWSKKPTSFAATIGIVQLQNDGFSDLLPIHGELYTYIYICIYINIYIYTHCRLIIYKRGLDLFLTKLWLYQANHQHNNLIWVCLKMRWSVSPGTCR